MPRPRKSKPPVPYRTWLAVDVGTYLLQIEVTGYVGATELAAIYRTLAAHFHTQRMGAPKQPRLLLRASRYCDVRISFVGEFDAVNVAPLMAAVQAQHAADQPELVSLARASWLKRCRAADAARAAGQRESAAP